MAQYCVFIPVTGELIVTVQADDENKARDKAWDDADFRVQLLSPNVDVGEFHAHDHVVRGNVFYGTRAELEVKLLESGEGS